MRGARHVIRMWNMRHAYKIFVGKPLVKRSFGIPRHIDGNMLVTFTVVKLGVRMCASSGYRPVVTRCDFRYKPTGSIKSGELPEYLVAY
jgi:hypothetical protein